MSENPTSTPPQAAQEIPFKAETRQVLDILIHSLYKEREIFLRELISNAADALTRLNFEMLTNRQVANPEAELGIWIHADEKENTLTLTDTGIGMTADELVENLGTIAHSGARAFIAAAGEVTAEDERDFSDIIGQFGVGFYSAFMVAEWIRVTSRSYRPDAEAAAWFSTGADTFSVEPAQKDERGTQVVVKLKEEAAEFAKEYRLREVIRKHSDFIPFPIYLGEKKEQVNRQTAVWRQAPRQVEEKDYEDFYRQLTLNIEPPLAHTHLAADAPVQAFAILYIPAKAERDLFSLRKEEGLKLYSRKVLIQDYCKDLLPEYFAFIQGVVDSEDLPLNVSRETVQSNRMMAQLKKLLTGKALDMLAKLAQDEPQRYHSFWEHFSRPIKQGVAVEQSEPERLYPLLRFHTTTEPEGWSSLDEYLERTKPGQTDIFYILGDEQSSAMQSPHLDALRKRDFEVLLLTDPMDAFMLVRLNQYKDHALLNVAAADLKLPDVALDEGEEQPPSLPVEAWSGLVDRFKQQLGERAADVRMTDRLSGSPARLVDAQDAPRQEMQRVYRLLKEDFEIPKKVLELNPRHAILMRLNQIPPDHPLNELVIEQIFENALLIEGLHKDPASMIPRIYRLIESALD